MPTELPPPPGATTDAPNVGATFVPKRIDRTTVILQVSHVRGSDPPHAIDHRYEVPSVTAEQVFDRHTSVGVEWVPVPLAWIERPGLIVVRNRVGENRPTQPSPAELAADAKLVIEIDMGDGVAVALVRPGRFASFEPSDAARMRLRCPSGDAAVSVTVYPS